jgi:hypothetical protein
MKQKPEGARGDEPREVYDAKVIRSGVRGKYLDRYRSGTNIVRLAPDVAAVFATEEAVNEALRKLIRS